MFLVFLRLRLSYACGSIVIFFDPLFLSLPLSTSGSHCTTQNEAFVKTFKALHFETTVDPISGDTQGAFTNPLSIGNGKRAYSASAYYTQDVSNRPNLHVITNTLVEKILFEKLENESTEPGQVRATGVEFAVNSDQKTVQARNEVIVACGAVKTPQLLELSGIGDTKHLSHHGIEVLIDNKQVGENLQ